MMEEIWTRSLGFWLLWCKCVWPHHPTWEWPSACILDQGCLYLYIHLWKLIWNRKIIQLKRSFSFEPTIPGPWVKKMSRILGRPKGGFQSIIFHVKNLHLKIICKAVVFFSKNAGAIPWHTLYTHLCMICYVRTSWLEDMLYEHVLAKEIDIVNVLQAKCGCFTFWFLLRRGFLNLICSFSLLNWVKTEQLWVKHALPHTNQGFCIVMFVVFKWPFTNTSLVVTISSRTLMRWSKIFFELCTFYVCSNVYSPQI